MVRCRGHVACEVVDIVKRQLNTEPRPGRRCGPETFFDLRVDERALNDQIALTGSQGELDPLSRFDVLRRHHVVCL
jgi:hypothetical protein